MLAIVGSVYDYVIAQDAATLIQDGTMRLGTEVASKGTSIFFIVINVLFLALVFYKMWRQQKSLTDEEETEKVA